MLKKWTVLSIVFTLLFSINYAQPVIPEDVKSEIKSRVDNGVNPSIVVGVINADGSSFYSYGNISVSDDKRADKHTIYEIGSISKTFTGVILAELVQRGKVKYRIRPAGGLFAGLADNPFDLTLPLR